MGRRRSPSNSHFVLRLLFVVVQLMYLPESVADETHSWNWVFVHPGASTIVVSRGPRADITKGKKTFDAVLIGESGEPMLKLTVELRGQVSRATKLKGIATVIPSDVGHIKIAGEWLTWQMPDGSLIERIVLSSEIGDSIVIVRSSSSKRSK